MANQILKDHRGIKIGEIQTVGDKLIIKDAIIKAPYSEIEYLYIKTKNEFKFTELEIVNCFKF